LEEITIHIKNYGPVITIAFAILTATPPVYKTYVRPIMLAMRNAVLNDMLEDIDKLKSHANSRVSHLNAKQRKILKSLEGQVDDER